MPEDASLFADQSDAYARYRPQYPLELYQFLSSITPGHKRCWDCATGNGQAAIQLADYFEQVYASDISREQLAQAIPHERISYFEFPASQTSFEANSFDLITVAQAYHWLDWSAFSREAHRVGKTNAVVAIWMYDRPQTGNDEIDGMLESFYRNTTGPYWDERRRFVDQHYQTVLFPYPDIINKEFVTRLQWSREQMVGYLSSWSAVQQYIRANGCSPLPQLAENLEKSWPSGAIRAVHFPIYLRAGRLLPAGTQK